jgi:hypothetical protein
MALSHWPKAVLRCRASKKRWGPMANSQEPPYCALCLFFPLGPRPMANGPRPPALFTGPFKGAELLNALSLGVRLRLIDNEPVIQVRDPLADIGKK